MYPEIEDESCNDGIVSFTLNESVRGRIARIDKSLSTILSQHNYPCKVINLIAEAILLTVMIGHQQASLDLLENFGKKVVNFLEVLLMMVLIKNYQLTASWRDLKEQLLSLE